MNLRVRDCSYTTANDVLAGKAVCDFDLKTDLFSWIDEDVQHLGSDSTEADGELIRENS